MLQGNATQFIVALDSTGRAMMTRDMELIRKIFAEIRGRNDVSLRAVEIPGVEERIVARHVEMLRDAGLVEGVESGSYNSPFPIIAVKDLTMEGHDFAASLANEGVRGTLKKSMSAADLAALPIRIVQSVASDLLMKWAKSKVGL